MYLESYDVGFQKLKLFLYWHFIVFFFVLVHRFAEWTGAVMKITEREISLRVSPKQKFSKFRAVPRRPCLDVRFKLDGSSRQIFANG